jgi:hypothetical protein
MPATYKLKLRTYLSLYKQGTLSLEALYALRKQIEREVTNLNPFKGQPCAK